MTGVNWLAVGGMAQLVAAGATLILAVFTYAMAKRTHELADKAQDQVEAAQLQVAAAQREAKATENLAIEARTDRQLAWRPHLELVEYLHEGDRFDFTVRNAGAGPAFRVECLAREIKDVSRWGIVSLPNLQPGESAMDTANVWIKGGGLISPFENFPGSFEYEFVTVVLFCEDALGRRFRFGQMRPEGLSISDPSWRSMPPDVSTVTDEHPFHSDWADEPMVWR
jgi:hypothetical protein